jgi:Ni/Fe-hydrogenase b-type cytochrome subunit
MKKLYIHPIPVRIWHWLNVACFVVLVVTGTQIRYLDLFDLLSFRTAVTLHNAAGFALIGNFAIWLVFYLFSDKNRAYHPEFNLLKQARDSFRQMQYYGWGMFRGEHPPFPIDPYAKFNPLQRLLYQILMLALLPMQFFTGLLIWDVKRFSGVIEMLGGLRVVDTVHVLIFIFFVFYLFLHPYLATLGHTPTAHIKAMVTGYEDVDDDAPAVTAP